MLGDGAHMLGLGTHRENPAGDAWVQRLDAAIEHFGEAGDVGDLAKGLDSGVGESFVGSSGGENLDTEG